jgi:hypothetical protein
MKKMNSIFTFMKGLNFKPKNKLISTKAAFILAGILSTVWFLLRVIPKPQRAMYPCMRAAAPIMSSFVIWTLSVLGMMVAFKKAKSNLAKSRFVFTALFAVAFLLSAIFVLSQNGETIYAKYFSSARAVTAPTGTGKGIFPGRVAWTYSSNAAKWTGSGNFWTSSVNSQPDYNASFTAGINSISGGSSDATSWDLMFKWFNNSHGRTGTGYVAGDKIAIKINQNNTAYSGTGGSGMNANPYACVAIVASLVNAGVPQADIWIGDPSRAVTDNIFNAIHTAYPSVNVVDYFGNNGRVKSAYTSNAFPNSQGIYTSLATCFVQARYLVSLPILKGHPGQYFSFGAKNWFGSHNMSNNWANNTHPGGNDWEAEYLTNANVGGKVILWCMDASYPSVNLDGTPSTNKGANFIMSLDGVAEESVSLDMWNSYYGLGINGETYIHNAATAGAGVHEHWDASKKYTRNYNPTANGIELLYVTPAVGPTTSITAPANASTVIKGATISISGTATPESGSTITKVEVTAGTTPLTVTGTTTWSCSYVASTAGSLTITAKVTSSSTKTGTASTTVTVKEPILLPAKIEAENYSAMSGITTETTTDVGGGLNVGYTDAGDYMDYLVTVPSTGTYTIDFRVASDVTTGKIELRNAAGTALASVSQTVIGGWQGWSTKTVTANLTAGTQTLKLYYAGSGLNINWFEVKTSSILTTITLSPATASITAGQTQQFTAVGKDQNGTVMTITPTWSTTGGGTINATGLYSATTAGGPFTVTASVGTISGSAQITVTPQVLSTITVSPASATITAGQTQQYTAVGKDQNGTVMTITPTWATTGGGTISASGLFTSTVAGGPFSVSATVGTVSGTASVTVSAAPVLTTITVSPALSTITVGQTLQLTAVGKDQNGTVVTITPTWATTGGGTISTSGLYTATTEGGPFNVSATVAAISGSAQVTVNPAPASQVIQAESYTGMLGIQTEATTDAGGGLNVGYIDAGDWMTYSVTIPQAGTYSVNFRVAGWAATGRISLQNAANTTLTSANIPNGGTGAYQVWSTVAGEANFTLAAGTQTIRIYAAGAPWNLNWFEIKSVQPSVLTTITVTPATASVVSGSNQQYTAVGKDQFGNVMAITPTWSATGGTISTSGLYTAGATTGIFSVTAQSGTISGSVPVTITAAPVLTTITLSPLTATINVGQTQQFTAVGKDQNGNVMTIAPSWTATAGTVSGTGLYTAPATAGSYIVTATQGTVSGSATVTVNIASGIAIPGTLQAEAYTQMFGLTPTATTIGYVDPGDWLEYTVNIAKAGTYTMAFNVASTLATGKCTVKIDGGASLGTFTAPNTGSWAVYQNASINVVLPAGVHTLRIDFTAAAFNLDYIVFTEVVAATNTVAFNPPAVVESGDMYTIAVTYTSTTANEVQAALFTNAFGWVVGATQTVAAGSGTLNFNLTIPATTAVATTYIWQTEIRPVGGTWQTRYNLAEKLNIQVTNLKSAKIQTLVNEVNSKKVLVYPSSLSINSTLHVQLASNNSASNVKIYDWSGKCIVSKLMNSNTLDIQIDNKFSKGMYIVNINGVNSKFIVQ